MTKQALEQFREQRRRRMDRPLALRLVCGFWRTYRPGLNDAPWRAFHTMAGYETHHAPPLRSAADIVDNHSDAHL